MTKAIMAEALEEVRRNGRLDIQERVFAKMKPHDPLADLVARFSAALLEKLRAAEAPETQRETQGQGDRRDQDAKQRLQRYLHFFARYFIPDLRFKAERVWICRRGGGQKFGQRFPRAGGGAEEEPLDPGHGPREQGIKKLVGKVH